MTRNRYILVTVLFSAVLLPSIACGENKKIEDKTNLIVNGSFEENAKHWGYVQWKGLPLPGRISEELSFEGNKHFILTEPGTIKPRFVRTKPFKVIHKNNYTIRFALATQDIPKGSIKIRAQQYGVTVNNKSPVLGWISPIRKGVHELIPVLKGTTYWQTFTVHISGKILHPKVHKLAIYFEHQTPSMGELKIDALTCTIN